MQVHAAQVEGQERVQLEENDEWPITRRYMTLETLAETGDTVLISVPAIPA